MDENLESKDLPELTWFYPLDELGIYPKVIWTFNINVIFIKKKICRNDSKDSTYKVFWTCVWYW